MGPATSTRWLIRATRHSAFQNRQPAYTEPNHISHLAHVIWRITHVALPPQNLIPLNLMAGHLGEGHREGHCRERWGSRCGGCGAVWQWHVALGATTRRKRPVALGIAGRRSRLQPLPHVGSRGDDLGIRHGVSILRMFTPLCDFSTEGACTLRARCRFWAAWAHLRMIPPPPSWEWEGKLIGRCLVAVTISI